MAAITRPPIAIAIIDDNRFVREALTAMLARIADFAIEEIDLADPAALTATTARVILLDAGLGDEDSLAVAARVAQEAPTARVIVMDVLPESEEIAEFVNAGVAGFAPKDSSFDEFVKTIRAVAAGEKVLPASMTESLFAQIAKETRARGTAPTVDAVRMTPREHQVIGLIGEGLSNKEIAQRLNIATHTVKSHVRNVMEKLALHTRLQIAAYSHRAAGG